MFKIVLKKAEKFIFAKKWSFKIPIYANEFSPATVPLLKSPTPTLVVGNLPPVKMTPQKTPNMVLQGNSK